VANNKVYRYVPRRNDAVNDTWICDAGRMSYREIGSADRMKQCSVRSESGQLESAGLDQAVEAAAGRLRRLIDAKGPGVIAGIASAHATNEDLFTFQRFLSALGSGTSGVAVVRGDSDDLLVKAEKAPNATGARELGFGDAKTVIDRIANGGVDALIAMGHDIVRGGLLENLDSLAALDTVIVLDTHVSVLQRVAHVMLPVRHVAERHGTLVNVGRRVQRVAPAVDPAWEAYSDGEVLSKLGAALGLEGFDGSYDVRAVGRDLAAANPVFAGIDLDTVGDGGRSLAERSAAQAER
jgi:NADH-quinone oxidoreductase subunit G